MDSKEARERKAERDSGRLKGTESAVRRVDHVLEARGEPQTVVAALPDVPRSFEGVWEIIESEIVDAEKLKALRLWIAGDSLWDAADDTGVKRKALWHLVQQYGLAKIRYTTESLMGLHKIAAHLALETIIVRLLEHPDEFKTKDLGVVAGISSDKLGAYEGWARSGAKGGEDYASGLSKFGADIAKSLEHGGSVKFELTVERPEEAIDVVAVPVEDPE